MFKIKKNSELKDEGNNSLLKKCEICHQHIAVKSKITFAGKKIWLCTKCYKIVKF